MTDKPDVVNQDVFGGKKKVEPICDRRLCKICGERFAERGLYCDKCREASE